MRMTQPVHPYVDSACPLPTQSPLRLWRQSGGGTMKSSASVTKMGSEAGMYPGEIQRNRTTIRIYEISGLAA